MIDVCQLLMFFQGDGTREGTGKCSCDSGYEGDLCDECAELYFEEQDENSKTKCTGESLTSSFEFASHFGVNLSSCLKFWKGLDHFSKKIGW